MVKRNFMFYFGSHVSTISYIQTINWSMNIITAQKMKFSNRDFFSKYDQIPKKLNTANIATHFFELAELMFLCWILYHHIGWKYGNNALMKIILLNTMHFFPMYKFVTPIKAWCKSFCWMQNVYRTRRKSFQGNSLYIHILHFWSSFSIHFWLGWT